MRRTARDNRDRRPYLPPVERIELSWKNYRVRIIAAAVFLVAGVWLLARSVAGLLGTDPGWQVIEAASGAEAGCAAEFTFLYDLGAGELSAAAEKRALTAAYTEAAVAAYRLFNADESFEGVTNIQDLNRHPNEVLTVDEALYEAFALLERYGNRSVYLGPVYETYGGLFSCEEEWQAADFDPYVNPEVAAFYAEAAAYARDPGSVSVELLGDGQVRLNVSEEYLAFAGRSDTCRFVDFDWMANAFIADYLAQTLADQGYTHGVLTSYDGFIRNLDSREGTYYALNLYDREEQTVYPAAVMRYQGPMGIVSLRDYPMSDLDARRFYRTAAGDTRTPYLDISDGLCRTALPNLVCYAGDRGCGEILLEMVPVYIAEQFHRDALARLAAEGVESVCCEDGVIYPSDPRMELSQLYEDEKVRYSVAP